MTLDERTQFMLDHGFARLHNGRVIPVMRGGDETEDEKAEREKREAEEAAKRSEKTHSQADVDRIVQERLARDRKDRPSDDEIKELRDKATKFDEQEAANATELEKAQKRAEKAESDAATALAEAKETRLRSAILTEASKPDRKIVDADAALKLLDKSKLELDADGTPKNIAEAMDALLEASPFLVGGGTTTTTRRDAADQGARGSGDEQQLTSTDGMTPEEITKAVSEGRFDTYLATQKT